MADMVVVGAFRHGEMKKARTKARRRSGGETTKQRFEPDLNCHQRKL